MIWGGKAEKDQGQKKGRLRGQIMMTRRIIAVFDKLTNKLLITSLYLA